ncbi:la protein homolog [Hyalella azteca]|uniref:La protein homolog n=1 Tax=Hyalella azteca TaxID=294128 RepID=A0A8B7P5Y8_HYAAZ|nr:la protein homolog [Hyalella azteca]XP_018021468.1 la protein homolog [Hyalella azteca]
MAEESKNKDSIDTQCAEQTEAPATDAKQLDASPVKDKTQNNDTKEEPTVDEPTSEDNPAPEEKVEAPADSVNSEDASKNGEINSQLRDKIVTQIEYYFGNYNLPRDKFLSAEIKKDNGWVPLSTMTNFARLAKLTKDCNIIATAIKSCENTFMEVDPTLTKIRRSVDEPLPELDEDLKEESIKRTIYCKGFPKDGSVTLDELLEYFKQFGSYDSVKMRTYIDKTTNANGFKGSVLVVFKTAELAKAFLERPPTQYKKLYLVKKWFADYLEEKKKERDERLAKKAARLAKTGEANGEAKEAKPLEEVARGSFLLVSGFKENTSREDIKNAIFDLTHDCAFVDFRRGEDKAYVRFTQAGTNQQMLTALQGNLKVNGADVTLSLVEGEEEDAQIKKANEARHRAVASGQQQGKKRRGGFGGRGGRSKRQRR